MRASKQATKQSANPKTAKPTKTTKAPKKTTKPSATGSTPKWSAGEPVMLGIGEFKPYSLNPKDHPPEQIEALASFIKRIGFKFPIAIDENDCIIAGHGRHIAAQRLGMFPLDRAMRKRLEQFAQPFPKSACTDVAGP